VKKLKFTPEQAVRFSDSRAALERVLNQVKLNTLEGRALDAMKLMERAVQDLEAASMLVGR
jgi:hypothetical protein